MNEFRINEIDMGTVLRSTAGYHKGDDDDSIPQLKFDPPVYQQRYSTVLNILSSKKWRDQIKKVRLKRLMASFPVWEEDSKSEWQQIKSILDKFPFQVVEFGCADMSFVPLLRRIDTIEQILQVISIDIIIKWNAEYLFGFEFDANGSVMVRRVSWSHADDQSIV